MLKSLKNIFQFSQKDSSENQLNEELNLLCGLMVEAALIDGKIDQEEINKIKNTIIHIFNEDSVEVDIVLKKCLKEINEPKSLHAFTSKINKLFSDEKKILLIETLWEIVLEDKNIHEFEANLIRRLAGLLYISDVNSGNAKKRALSKLENTTKKEL